MKLNHRQIRKLTANIVSEFFCDAEVVWVEQSMTKPTAPYVTLKTRNSTKSLHPILIGAERYYACTVSLEMNLYTKGRRVTEDNYENTAEDDLMDFVQFLESDYMQEELAKSNVSIQLIQQVRDLTELYYENVYRYRAFAEFTISYMADASGRYGLGSGDNMNNSGGNQEYRNQEEYLIEKVEIEEEQYEH